MKPTVLLMLLACLLAGVCCYGQRVSVDAHNESLEKLINFIGKQAGYGVLAESEVYRHASRVTIALHDATLFDAVDTIMRIENLNYQITDSLIRISPGPRISETDQQELKIDVNGTAVNEDGAALPYATISALDGKGRKITNGGGNFVLKNVSPGTRFVVSYTGYNSEEFIAAEHVRLTLRRSDSMLDQAVIIPYGTKTERLITEDVTTVTADDIETQPVDNPLLALEGRVPGLNIVVDNGLPGSGMLIRIEGQNSIANGNDPLVVVDGVPYPTQMLTPIGGILGSSGNTSANGNPLNYLNPADIESISILRNADATAIYGSKGANGVILITTKKAKTGDTRFSLGLQQGWFNVADRMRLMNSWQYLQMRRQAIQNDGLSVLPTDFDLNGIWDSTRFTDWQKTLIGNTAHYVNIHGGLSGGNANTQFLLSGTYSQQTSVFPGNFSDTHESLHWSLSHRSPDHRLTLQLMIFGLYDINRLPQVDLTTQALTLAPDAPAVYQPNGALNWQLLPNSEMATWANPLADLYKPYQLTAKNAIGHMGLSYKFPCNLMLTLNTGATGLYTEEFSGIEAISLPDNIATALGANSRSAHYSNGSIQSWILEPQVNYTHPFSIGTFNVLLGANLQEQSSNGESYAAYNFPSDALLEDKSAAGTLNITSTVQDKYRYCGIFGRMAYDYRGQYLLNITVMRDGSSRFGPNTRFHDFVAAGIGWVFTEQKIVHRLFSALSFGKIRASYGTTGNDQIGDYRYLDLYSAMNVGVPYQGITALAPTDIPNPNLQWEETKKLQLGIDLRLFKDRIILTVDYNRNTSSNQLLDTQVPQLTGAQLYVENLPATVRNTGVEGDLQTVIIRTRKIRWMAIVDYTLPSNKLIRYVGNPLASDLEVGKPLDITRVFVAKGVDPTSGRYNFLDSHGALTMTPSTATDLLGVVSTNFPSRFGGVGSAVNYGNIELSVFFQFVGAVAASNTIGFASGPGYAFVNQPLTVQTRWQHPGDITSIERYGTGLSASFFSEQLSTGAYSNASYWRLKNVSFAWQAAPLFHRYGIKDLKFFAHARNLLTFTRYTGLDPQTGSAVLPPLRMITGGIEFSI